MRQAAQRAEALGATELAEQLSKEVETCEGNAQPSTAGYVSRRVDEVVCDVPHLTFDALKNYLAAELLMTPPELCSRYKRLRQVYDEAKRDWAC